MAVHPGPAAAQRAAEIGLHALLTTSSPVLWGGGVYGAFRPSTRFRIAATVAAGETDGDVAARGELLGHFLLNPTNLGGIGAYAGGGVAGTAGLEDRGYLVLLLGIEAGPGARDGWALEAGVGGGLRLAAGYRWRRFAR
jgi:hypothetical protein